MRGYGHVLWPTVLIVDVNLRGGPVEQRRSFPPHHTGLPVPGQGVGSRVPFLARATQCIVGTDCGIPDSARLV